MIYFVILAISMIPRLLKLGFDVFNTDAFFWKENTYNFMGLLASARFGDMAITHHPGVTLMWLGGIGMKLYRGLYLLVNQVAAPDIQSTVLWTHFAQKLPVALVLSLTITGSYYLLRRLFDKGNKGDRGNQGAENQKVVFWSIPLVVTLILATEPWFVAHSRVFNTDALMTCFMWLAVLCLWLAIQKESFKRWAMLAGLFTGLALLTKSISLFLIPFTVLTLGLAIIIKKISLKKAIIICFLLSVFCFLTFVILWPSMWTQPLSTLKLYFNGIFLEGNTRLNLHNMFGNPTLSPGPIFYPLAFVFRLSPELIILFVIGLVGWVGKKITDNRKQITNNVVGSASWFLLLSALTFIIFYTVEITLASKKLDRYLLPVIPFVVLFASFGLSRLVSGFARKAPTIRKLFFVFFFLFSVYRAGVLVVYFPDFLAYYNPILGGPTQGYNFDGEWWGEGYHLVGSWINEKLEVGAVAVYDQRQLRPFVKDQIAVYDAGDKNLDPAKVDFWVLRYKGNGQREGYNLINTIYVATYPFWGIYRKL